MTRPTVRLVLAISLDGRIAFAGGAKTNLGGIKDREILEESLGWANATMMGSGTLKAHKSICLIHNPKIISTRESQGLCNQPITLIVSRKALFLKQNRLAYNSQNIFF